MDIDKIETDGPQGDAEEHLLGLTSESIIDDIFELVGIDGNEAFKNAIATGCIGCLFGIRL